MSNPWVKHVKAYAKKNNISYMCAVTEASKTYKKKTAKKTNVKKAAKKTLVKKAAKKPLVKKAEKRKRVKELSGTMESRAKKYEHIEDEIRKISNELIMKRKQNVKFDQSPYLRKINALTKKYIAKVGKFPMRVL
jgi:hypothetical protein